VKKLYYRKNGWECAIVFTENGLSTIRFTDTTVAHRVPPCDILTAEELEAHRDAVVRALEQEEKEKLQAKLDAAREKERLRPTGKRYLWEVLGVVEATKLNPRQPDETDEPWKAYLREKGVVGGEVKYENVNRFVEQWFHATTEEIDPLCHPGLYVHHEGANKYADNLYIRCSGPVPEGLPVEVHKEDSGDGWTIYNTSFVWSLIARDGFRLD
jgi:hypothetical protein